MDANPLYVLTAKYLKDYKIICHQGGTRSGKTFNILILLIDMARKFPMTEISVVSRDTPHLKKGARKDFLKILQMRNMYDDNAWNRTDSIYTFENRSYVEFIGVDDPGKVMGPGRDILFINEANHIKYEVWKQLLMRTRKKIVIDYNPFHPEHWIYDEVIPREDCKFIKSTYLDNYDFLEESQIQEIERMKTNEYYWKVFGLGERGAYFEGQIFKDWTRIDKMPDHEPFYGLDFGFTNDPTVLIEIQRHNDKVYVNELIYQTGLTNDVLGGKIKSMGINGVIYADSAEPKSIQELRNRGINVKASLKGKDSLLAGISFMKEFKISLTTDSLNLWREVVYYQWEMDSNNKPTNKPIDLYNHGMDAIRYGLYTRYKHFKFKAA